MKIIAPAIATITLGLAASVWAQMPPAAVPRPDTDGNGIVTRAEMQSHSAAMFDQLDMNKDGRIDMADRDARMSAMFDKIDTSHDGQISRDEFMAHHLPPASAMGHEGHKGMREGGMKGHGMKGHDMKGHGMGMMLLHMADADKDGAVTRDEFMAAAGQHFDRVDANKNGEITTQERRAAHRAMRRHMQDATDAKAHDHGSAD